MYLTLLNNKLNEQAIIYKAVQNGDTSLVQFKPYTDEIYGTQDENYLNRQRLCYYLLYNHIFDEQIIVYLFKEEITHRKNNSFQGIGNVLNILTSMINQNSLSEKYSYLLDEAKNANFDCACGYDRNIVIDNQLNELRMMECIYLSQDLEYKEIMESIVNMWKDSINEWTESSRNTLIQFNSFLGKEKENEELYHLQLEDALKIGKTNTIIRTYNKIVRYYLDSNQIQKAYLSFMSLLENSNYHEIIRIRLFGDVLEECFEIICKCDEKALSLWKWAKPYLQKRENMYGNLYIKGIEAANAVKDSYVKELETRYDDFKEKTSIKYNLMNPVK